MKCKLTIATVVLGIPSNYRRCFIADDIDASGDESRFLFPPLFMIEQIAHLTHCHLIELNHRFNLIDAIFT